MSDETITFSITPARLRQVYDSLYEYYTRYGYHSWEYWRTTETAAAVYGELLDTVLSETNEEAWGAVWQNWLMEKAGEGEPPAATE